MLFSVIVWVMNHNLGTWLSLPMPDESWRISAIIAVLGIYAAISVAITLFAAVSAGSLVKRFMETRL